MSETSGSPPPRKRGGFYRKQYQGAELKDLSAGLSEGLQDEIGMLRVVIRRVMQLFGQEEVDLEEATKVLNSLGAAAVRLAKLLKEERELNRDESGLEAALRQALEEVNRELRGEP